MVASTATTVIWALVGFVILIGLIAGWRVIVHDRSISRIRFGFFWERERSADLEHQPRHDDPQQPPPTRRPSAPRRDGDQRAVQWPLPRPDPDREPSHPGARKDDHGADT
jgi:hypothetical protein